MSRINCHSAFKHYEMFHSRGGDVINIGSNNTTIFNTGAGFGGGSFWSGFGYGLGNGLGSIFGGLFGGNMGGFGNFGFGMSPFGMGGFGMSPFTNLFMTPFGGISGFNLLDRLTKSKDSEEGKGKVKNDNEDKHAECKDPDQKKINKFRDDVQDIQGLDNPDKAKVKAKYDEIVKAKKDQDDTHKAENTAAYDNLLEDLQKLADKNGWGKLDDKDFGIDKSAKKPVAPEVKDDATENKQTAKKPITDNNGNVNDSNDAKNNANGTEPWSNVSAWNNARSLIPHHITLPDGYSKLAPNDTIYSIDKVHDNSGKTKDVKGDTKKSTETYKAQDENTTFPTYLAITTDDNNAYNYKIIGMSNGYPIYGTPQSDINKNVYVMCKGPDGKVVLLQLNKFSGYGIKDAQN